MKIILAILVALCFGFMSKSAYAADDDYIYITVTRGGNPQTGDCYALYDTLLLSVVTLGVSSKRR